MENIKKIFSHSSFCYLLNSLNDELIVPLRKGKDLFLKEEAILLFRVSWKVIHVSSIVIIVKWLLRMNLHVELINLLHRWSCNFSKMFQGIKLLNDENF